MPTCFGDFISSLVQEACSIVNKYIYLASLSANCRHQVGNLLPITDVRLKRVKQCCHDDSQAIKGHHKAAPRPLQEFACNLQKLKSLGGYQQPYVPYS